MLGNSSFHICVLGSEHRYPCTQKASDQLSQDSPPPPPLKRKKERSEGGEIILTREEKQPLPSSIYLVFTRLQVDSYRYCSGLCCEVLRHYLAVRTSLYPTAGQQKKKNQYQPKRKEKKKKRACNFVCDRNVFYHRHLIITAAHASQCTSAT